MRFPVCLTAFLPACLPFHLSVRPYVRLPCLPTCHATHSFYTEDMQNITYILYYRWGPPEFDYDYGACHTFNPCHGSPISIQSMPWFNPCHGFDPCPSSIHAMDQSMPCFNPCNGPCHDSIHAMIQSMLWFPIHPLSALSSSLYPSLPR